MSTRPKSSSDRRFRRLGHVGVTVAVALLVATAVGGSSAHSPAVDVSVINNAPEHVIIQYQFQAYDTHQVDIDGQSYAELRLPSEPVLTERGAPALPHVARSVIVPDQGTVTLNVVDAQYYDLKDVFVAPSKGAISRQTSPDSVPYAFGAAYEANAFYPGTLAEVGEVYVMRDFRGARADVYPFQYNPVTHVLRVYTSMTIEVATDTALRGSNELSARRANHATSRAFGEIYQSHFLNYEPELRYTPMDETGEMLVICNDAWMANMQPFVDHKNEIGITTTMVGISTIGNTTTAIKNYIQSFYNDANHDLAFVLLVGDYAQVTSPLRVGSYGAASDPSYTLLVGTDNYPEIIIGRFSAETSAQVDTQVQRSVEYEVNQATLQPWFWRGVGIASAEGTGDDNETDIAHMNLVRTGLLGLGYTQIDQIYDPGASASTVTTALNAGRGIINYCGHGSITSWGTTGYSNSNISTLTNDNLLPFIVAVACNNGEFDGGTCFAEAWMRATHNGEPTGAVGTYMASITQPWDPPMEGQDEFNIQYAVGTYHSYGAFCFAGSCSMMDDYPGGADTWGTGPATFLSWILFGDPSLRIVGITEPPTGLKVTPKDDLIATGNYGDPVNPASAEYTLENKNADPMSYEVTVDVPWVDILNGSGTIPAESTVVVTVAFNSAAEHLDNGAYAGTLTFTNLTDHDGDTTRGIELTMGVPAPQVTWNMDEDPGWETSGSWAWGQPLGGGGAHGGADPTAGHTGTMVYGYNLGGDYEALLPERALTTTVIDCTDYTQVSLRFWRWLGVEQGSYDHAYVRVSNGTTWTNIWANTTEVADTSWQYQQFDISALADHQPTVYVRWVMGPTDGSWNFCGWNIDDVEIWGLAPVVFFDKGDMNCDYTIDFADINPFVAALTDPAKYTTDFPSCDIMQADVNDDGTVDFGDINPFVALLVAPPQ